MHVKPQRRRRALRVHFLRQQGLSLREIGEQLGISHATVRADLRLAETHWSSIAAAADDLLLESLQLLQLRLTLAVKNADIAANAERLTSVEYLRAQDAHQTQLDKLAREIRRTAGAVHQRAAQRPDQPDLYDEEPQELAETSTKSSKTFHPEETISSPQQEIVQNPPSEEKIPADAHPVPVSHGAGPALDAGNPLPLPDYEALIQDVLAAFPHLKGKSNEQILQFLDQFTDPNQEQAQLQPTAAG